MKKAFWQRPFLWVLIFQVYALVLVWLAYRSGVHTDEAKYLLNIPYPHPPILRTFLSWFDGWSGQELFARTLFSTLLIQSVWKIYIVANNRTRLEIGLMMLLYLASATVIAQAGTVMFATITSVQLLGWYWLSVWVKRGEPGFWGLLWLLTVLCTFQGILITPLACMAVYKSTRSFVKTSLVIGFPIVILGLYALSNPFALAALVSHTGSTSTVMLKLLETGKLWMIGGALIVSIVGTLCILLTKQRSVQCTALLVALYVLIGPQPHYALLFTMVFTMGLLAYRLPKNILIVCTVLGLAGNAWLLWQQPLLPKPTAARETIAKLQALPELKRGLLLITDPFGHEWQYESPWPVAKFSPTLLPRASAVICTKEPCPTVKDVPLIKL